MIEAQTSSGFKFCSTSPSIMPGSCSSTRLVQKMSRWRSGGRRDPRDRQIWNRHFVLLCPGCVNFIWRRKTKRVKKCRTYFFISAPISSFLLTSSTNSTICCSVVSLVMKLSISVTISTQMVQVRSFLGLQRVPIIRQENRRSLAFMMMRQVWLLLILSCVLSFKTYRQR